MPTYNEILLVAAVAVIMAVVIGVVIRREKKKPSFSPELAVGILCHAAKYEGLFEGLYQTASREAPGNYDAYLEWLNRTENIRGDDGFRQAFEREFPSGEADPQKLRRLLLCIREAGILRVEEQTHTIGPDSRRRYVCPGGDMPPEGTACRVLKPCWVCGDRVIEQGMIMEE